jgi:hypothetical protein
MVRVNPRKYIIKTFKNRNNLKILSFVIVLLLVAQVTGVFAVAPSIIFEAESGTISGNVVKQTDSSASAGNTAVFGAAVTPPPPAPPPTTTGIYPIKASPNGRYLLTADNKFFYYYADTSWHAPARMNQADIVTLLNDRKTKGFNTIQMSLLMFPNLGPVTNVYGDNPFVSTYDLSQPKEVGARTSDPNSPDYDYWDHIDYIINQAASRGMQINFVASWYGWGGWDWRGRVTNTNATAYGTFLGKRFGDKPNIMWSLGGDNNPDTSGNSIIRVPSGLDTSDKTQASRNMGNAIRNNESIRHLMSYHPVRNYSSSDFFKDQAWHTISYAYSDEEAYTIVQSDYNRTNPLPVINPEALYDNNTDAVNVINGYPVLSNQRLRAQAYWTYLSGGVGFAYGHMNIWDAEPTWKNFIQAESTKDMQRLIGLFEKYKIELVPDHRSGNSTKMLTSGYGTYNLLNYATSARAVNNSVGLTYFPSSRGSIIVNLASFGGGSIKLSWFNPATAATATIGTYAGSGTTTVTYPSGYSDAVLVAEKQ